MSFVSLFPARRAAALRTNAQATPTPKPKALPSAAAHKWPFMAGGTPAEPTASGYGPGVPPRQEVEFHDGTRIWLHRVERAGTVCLFRRELSAPAAGVVVDLRHLVPSLQTDLVTAQRRDVPGIVHFALRAAFGSRDAFVQAATACARPQQVAE